MGGLGRRLVGRATKVSVPSDRVILPLGCTEPQSGVLKWSVEVFECFLYFLIFIQIN